MKFLAIILVLILVVYQVDASEEEEGDINIVIEQHVELPGPPDVDECFEDIYTCADNEVCRNTPGSYRCVCADGFEKVDGICQDIDECIENENLCGDFGECINDPGSFHCDCDVGYQEDERFCKALTGCVMDNKFYNQGDVITKNYQSLVCGERSWLPNPEDVNECLDDEAFQCEENEECVDTRTGYECQCQEGYIRENNTCQACLSPSLYLEDLGCISQISDQMRSWDDMKTKCQADGKRLLEGIKYKHLEPLSNHFNPLKGNSYWIGMNDSRWVTSGEEVTDEDLWYSGYPTENNDTCGFAYLDPSTPGLADINCPFDLDALCQSLPSD